ncbi:wall-associated receptor kinase 5-like [Camellia sinensis]|uniref:wall-associated receptor kinase 5-like n=1 Tax=Camellia sinensis TaxID=4442 RepID=UPI001035C347|nr:wall-associated receptor kinase 5-like [Camellia sinensis]
MGLGSFAIGALVVLVSSSWSYWIFKKRKLIILKEKFFSQNGGLMLKQQLSRLERSTQELIKMFNSEELKRATNNYDESRIVGQGGFGTVYKGILPENKIVAIKKSQMVGENQIEQFINEVVVLSQINHRNVVKLLGYCFETQVPLLVYEFITNGTLFEYINNQSKASNISLENRLQIAAETAGVLSYLHSAASIPIIHRDVKATNILLDDNYIAKVSDFGASRFIPLDQNQLATVVQGTLGYLDPEYMLTSQFTEKSDVYSFGVVLVELITGKKASPFDRPEEDRCLAMYFISCMNNDCLNQIIDEHMVIEGNTEELKEVANLAKRCLRVKGEKRPSMKEVAMELQGLIRKKTSRNDLNPAKIKYLLGKASTGYVVRG